MLHANIKSKKKISMLVIKIIFLICLIDFSEEKCVAIDKLQILLLSGRSAASAII